MKKPKKTVLQELEESYAHWEHLHANGGQDPFWPDGTNLNLVRNHIMYYKHEIQENHPEYQDSEIYLRELPPEVPDSYMAQPEAIIRAAWESLDTYKGNADYLYLLAHAAELGEKDRKEISVGNVMGYVDGLKEAVNRCDLLTMRRHRDPERYLDSFRSCAEKMRAILAKPARQDGELIESTSGQFTFF